MGKHILLLGAGASASTGAPLMPRFMDRAHELLSEGADINKGAFERVFQVVQERLPQLVAKTAIEVDNNIEALYGLVEMGSLLERLPQTDPADLPQLADDLRTLLAETIEWSCPLQQEAPGTWIAPEDYRALASILNKAVDRAGKQAWTILSFNYDVALELALLNSEFRVDYGFAVMDPMIRKAEIAVLKLHGSLNWGMNRGGKLQHVDLRAFAASHRSARRRSVWALSREVSKLASEGGEQWTLGIAPPSWNKTRYHEAFAQIWRRAARELSDAETITVIGYSAPTSDGFFRDLLALGIAGPARLRRFTVVDPDPKVGTRFEALLGPLVRPRFEYRETTLNEFLMEFNKRVMGDAA